MLVTSPEKYLLTALLSLQTGLLINEPPPWRSLDWLSMGVELPEESPLQAHQRKEYE